MLPLFLTAAALTIALALAETRNLQLMSWNICGSQDEDWGCAKFGTTADKIGVVKYHVEENFVNAALLQEICENDLTALVDGLGSGWSAAFRPYQWSQDGVLSNNKCGNGRTDRIGTAIVVHAGYTAAQLYNTTQPWRGQNRPFHCVTATWWGTRLCVVHLTPAHGNTNPDNYDWEYADDQMKEIKAVVDGYPKVAFGGDFNVQPPYFAGNQRAWLWPSGFYSTGPGVAGYSDCDQGLDRDTHDGGYKIDFVFSKMEKRWCAVGASAYSDHHVLIYSLAITV
ncbi:hypothetical protein EXIGLDRAFT_770900 [Exidia glandulosa HHB12029]|uniref:Endonuclease/exonuclease/phosphatase domain-containing protein n=1 Tax=Exidia glandulosa HHB12029 TaxID=1314781 RepID=A0A165GCX7_EXIGL|nr:hypothetical protein EXIGLDRAFT_770900 [Exidia glandulosa HHB12029]